MPRPLPAQLRFEIRNWEERDFIKLHENTERLSKMAQSAGTGSERFQNTQRELLEAARYGEQALYDCLRKPIDIRALSGLLCSRSDEARRIELTPELVACLTGPRQQLSTLILIQLISAYFRRYDQFDNPQGLEALGSLLLAQLELRQGAGRNSQLSLYARHRSLLFSSDADKKLAERARSSGNFEKTIHQYGLATQSDSRLVTLARARYYVTCLEELPVGQDSELLKKVIQPEIRDAPLDRDGKLIGHEVLNILISRADPNSVSDPDPWRNTILSIAGDPRVPHGHPDYLKWWSRLPDLIEKVCGWLAGFDLELFLYALEQYGEHRQDQEMQRMYPARKRFLEGLLEQRIIKNTRLFISPDMEQYLIRFFNQEELPAYAIVKGSRSMIYLNVAGVHIIEGSHNRAIYGVPILPQESQILDFGVQVFHERSLGMGLLEQFEAESNRDCYDYLNVRHYPQNFSWQYEVIQYLQRHDVKLNIEKLFNPGDYLSYKRIHGLG